MLFCFRLIHCFKAIVLIVSLLGPVRAQISLLIRGFGLARLIYSYSGVF